MASVRSMLSAQADGRRVTIGFEPLTHLRTLSDARRLACPACGAPVVLKAGRVLAPHFAHLPGTACSHPEAEPETPAHREGKALLARWLTTLLPDHPVQVEAVIPETGQRADVLMEHPSGPVAIEYQCAELSGREWRRRHMLYRAHGIRDLWILGISRLHVVGGALQPGEMERAMRRGGAPLLFLDSLGERYSAGTLARFRTTSGGPLLRGSLSGRPLDSLLFPWPLLEWPFQAGRDVWRTTTVPLRRRASPVDEAAEARLRQWLQTRWRQAPERLPDFFGVPLPGAEALACSAALWQACLYCRFIEGRVGCAWWIGEVEVWTRRYLPTEHSGPRLLRRALFAYQEYLCAAGLLSLPRSRGAARVIADFRSLGRIPDPKAALRLASYRRMFALDHG